jgi:hypothetical protein
MRQVFLTTVSLLLDGRLVSPFKALSRSIASTGFHAFGCVLSVYPGTL